MPAGVTEGVPVPAADSSCRGGRRVAASPGHHRAASGSSPAIWCACLWQPLRSPRLQRPPASRTGCCRSPAELHCLPPCWWKLPSIWTADDFTQLLHQACAGADGGGGVGGRGCRFLKCCSDSSMLLPVPCCSKPSLRQLCVQTVRADLLPSSPSGEVPAHPGGVGWGWGPPLGGVGGGRHHHHRGARALHG